MNWNEIFLHLRGNLIWRRRGKSAFKTEKEWRRWTTRYAGKIAGCSHYAKRSNTLYWQISYGKKRYFSHNVIWEMLFGEIPEGMVIDHIDGNGLNNNPENLRLVTASVNQKNRPLYSNNKSGVPGVHFDKKSGRWYARVCINGKRETVYSGHSQEEAMKARMAASACYGYHENHGRASNGGI